MSDDEILAYILDKNPNGNQDEVAAFRSLMVRFNCEDSETPAEAQGKILASMDSIIEEIAGREPEEQAEILQRRMLWQP